MSYQLLDSGNQEKLEQFGPYRLIRPCQQAVWQPFYPKIWKEADGRFSRKDEGWKYFTSMPKSWEIIYEGIRLKIEPTSFGHLGLFPEHAILQKLPVKEGDKVLHLFAYTALGSLFLAKKGAHVCHVDASKPSLLWAKENALLNKEEGIRWILEDAIKFMKRQARKKERYDFLIMDPPTFGRGPKKELFKIEEDIITLLHLSKELLQPKGTLFFSCHTPGFTPITIENLLSQTFERGSIHAEEMKLEPKKGWPLPCGTYGIWEGK